MRILVQGLRRIEIADVRAAPSRISRARVRQLHDVYEPSQDLEAMQAHMVNQFAKFVSMIPYLPDELQVVVMNIKDPGKVTDLIASNLNISLEEKQELARTLDVRARLERLSTHPRTARSSCSSSGTRSSRRCRPSSTRTRRSSTCASRCSAIQTELGEGDSRDRRARGAARASSTTANLPPEARARPPRASSSACA